MSRTALLLGGTGLVGGHCLNQLVTDSRELMKRVRSKQESVAQEIRTLRSIGSIEPWTANC